MSRTDKGNRYERLIEKIFLSGYREGLSEVAFRREDIERFAKQLRVRLPKNLGDLIYSFRYRAALPESVRRAAPKGAEWIIEPAGRASYRFVLVTLARISPNASLAETKVPDSPAGIISKYAITDEQ